MKRAEHLCAHCIELPSEGGRIQSQCKICGDFLMSAHQPGYHFCAQCSQTYQLCMICGDHLPTPKYRERERLLERLADKLEGEVVVDHEKQLLLLTTSKLMAKIHFNEVKEYDRHGYQADLMVMVETKDRFERWGNCFYQKHIDYASSIEDDLRFIESHLDEVSYLASLDLTYHSQNCGPDYQKWYYLAWVEESTRMSRNR